MIMLACVLVMLIIAYTSMRDGLIPAFANLVISLLAIIVAFTIWPYVAFSIETDVRGGMMDAFEDSIPLILGFTLTVLALRFLSQSILKDYNFGFSDLFNRGGAFVVGLITGYFVSGFLVLVLQTIPWDENFLGFQPEKQGVSGRFFPADTVVLKYLTRLHNSTGYTADSAEQKEAFENFEKNFAIYRRFTETRPVQLYVPEPPKDANDKKSTDKNKDVKKKDPAKKDDVKKGADKKDEEKKSGDSEKKDDEKKSGDSDKKDDEKKSGDSDRKPDDK
ncbi:CvpA family protein [Telmatocola sphagniphila]|uniref:CvpA family protein n=1 Tax=Telmatocola sphagniphila TaxID=1123043 RepID=A0A8E6B8R2_9BACT|nr:CvpA family protein [Telmatocola sphagniphila]QVL33354.1 CvpA family protein [Telmatocola sphagniphila]